MGDGGGLGGGGVRGCGCGIYFHLHETCGCSVQFYTTKVLYVYCIILLKSSSNDLIDMLAVFMTSRTETVRNKMATLTVVFSRFQTTTTTKQDHK